MKLILPFTVLCILMSSYHIYGQVESMPVGEECFEIDRRDAEYFIQVNGVNYQDGDDVFICKNNLPVEIKIIYNLPGNVLHLDTVHATNWDWQECKCFNPATNNAINSIDSITFVNKSTMKVSFNENGYNNLIGNTVSLRVRIHEISNQMGIDISSHDKSNYGYDDHPSINYPFYHSDIDAKFLVDGQHDSLVFDIKRRHKNITKGISFRDSTPNIFDYSVYEQGLEILHVGINGFDSCFVRTCSQDTLLLVDIYPPTKLNVNLYILHESNDDFANYCIDYYKNDPPYASPQDVRGDLLADCITPINSLPNPSVFECINPGIDGSIDLYNETTFGYWKRRRDNNINMSSDSLVIDVLNRSKLKILPSNTNGHYFCNSRPVTLETYWNTDINGDGVVDSYINPTSMSIDVTKAENNLNTIFNKMGTDVNVVFKGEHYRNYNSFSYVANDKREQNDFHVSFFGGDNNNMITPDTTSVFIIDSVYNSSQLVITDPLSGRATGDNNGVYNTVFINHKEFRDRTITHEIMHAKYALQHPDTGKGQETGWMTDRLHGPESSDRYNIMNSGYLYNNGSVHLIHQYRIRKYQWKKIRR